MTASTTPKISVLVPCYNVAHFVAECLMSLKVQTLNDIEVICLNDGSTDNTLALIRETVADDPRFRIVDKPNSGYGATMNLGLKMARGEYIGIVESDDFVEKTMFEKLYSVAVEHELDIARCCFNTLLDGRVKPNRCHFLPKDLTVDPKVADNVFRHPPTIWAAIYRKDTIERNGIRFMETPGAAYQDISFAFKTTLMAKRIRCIPECLINYRIHAGNSVKKASNPFIVMEELDECIRYARYHHTEDIVSRVMLDIEYATFKWNYLRLPQAEAHRFFEAWLKRWQKHAGYGRPFDVSHLNRFFHYLAVTRFPNQFEQYLLKKSQS